MQGSMGSEMCTCVPISYHYASHLVMFINYLLVGGDMLVGVGEQREGQERRKGRKEGKLRKGQEKSGKLRKGQERQGKARQDRKGGKKRAQLERGCQTWLTNHPSLSRTGRLRETKDFQC